ncbi:MAG: hypothetical protein ACRD82_08700 [Blastocatellia bacterium]
MNNSNQTEPNAADYLQERYLRDPLPVRLGGLAANLARVKSFSDHHNHRETVRSLLTESQHFIEWTAADASLPQQVELLELQRTLARWRLAWNEIWNDPERRSRMAAEARQWSNRVLESSGLLQT